MKIQKQTKDKLKAFKEKLKGIGLECTQVKGFQYINKRTGKVVDVDAHERCFKKKVKGPTVKVKKVEPEETKGLKDESKKESEKLAAAIKANNGHPMSKTPDGKESILYKSILDEVGGDAELADKIKANVYSDEFKEWFGDWQGGGEFDKNKVLSIDDDGTASKVVDLNGEPLMVYHGGSVVDEFRTGYVNEKGEGDKGIYFTENKFFANDIFASQIEIAERDKRNDDYSDIKSAKDLELLDQGAIDPKNHKYASLFTGYLSLKNPTLSEVGNANVISRLYEKGKDGFITPSTSDYGYGAGQYVAFDSSQIKSIFNDGSFSTKKVNIYGTKISKVIKGTKYAGMTIREIMQSTEGRKFLNENYF